MVIIRNAEIEDLHVLAAVEAACFPPAEAATKKDIRTRLEVYPECFWMIFEDDQVVGFIDGMATDEPDLCDEMYENASLHKKDGAWQMIFGLNTLPEYRCQGYAGKLIDHMVYDARKKGRKGLVLTCKEHLLHYYSKFGFVNEGVSASEHGGVLWYQMRLTF